MAIDPNSVTVGNGPTTGNASAFEGEKLRPLPALLPVSGWLSVIGCLRSARVSTGRSLQRSAPPGGRPGRGRRGGPGEAGPGGRLPQ